jgi:hypothetical protein
MMSFTIASEHDLIIQDKSQIADAISLCFGTEGFLLTENDVGQDFFRLESGVAGELFQKLVNYRIKAAFVCSDPSRHGRRFSELALEHSSHSQVRFFRTQQEAICWLGAGVRASA